jgi:thiol-disulfide isomerase/thioredoxin
MMNRIALLLIVITATVMGCGKAKEEKKDVVVNATPSAINDLPPLFAYTADNTRIFMKDRTGKIVILFFNPDCDHCQREATMISQNKDVFNGWEVYFLSPDTITAITKFSTDYNLTGPNFHFAHIDGQQTLNAVGPITTVPTFMIYDNQAFVARMEGEISLPKLKQMLK